MKNTCDQYVASLRRMLENNADKENAYFMQKYMKNIFPFFGIRSPERKHIFRQFIKNEGYPSIQDLDLVIKSFYNQPERELHYFAMELADKYSKRLNERGIELFQYLIVNNSWWDTVDYISVRSLSEYFKVNPGIISQVTNEWMETGNLWLQRSCILFQLKYKRNTDLELLYKYIMKLRDSNEFFIQKAIGWILREYSKINPAEVIRFVSIASLKPLSRREALRILIKEGYFVN
jgi:3-methyladenine DNA glycosylase AlkD